MANRDAKLIERTLKDFSLGAMSGGGGLAPVDKLPEKGNVGTLYKTPDGNIYSWFHEETQEEVEIPPTLEVGKTYELKEKILIRTFEKAIDKALEDPNRRKQTESIEGDIINDNLTFNMGFSRDFEQTGNSTYEASFIHQVEGTDQIRYYYNEGGEREDDYVHRIINGWTGPTEITVTQEWIDNLNEDWKKTFDINNLNFLFVGTTEVVTVVNEGYVQLNDIVLDRSILEAQHFEIYLDDKNYDYQLIYNTAANGGNFVLKIPEYNSEEATEPDYYTFEMCTGYAVYPSNHEAEINFNNIGTTITLINKAQFMPTIKGQELIDLAQKFGQETGTNNSLLFGYLQHILLQKSTSEDLSLKELKDGDITVSMFEGLIQYTLETMNNMNESINFIKDSPATHEIWSSKPHEDVTSVNYILDHSTIYSSDVIYQDDFSNINPTKDYSCDITVYFADDTSITVPMARYIIYPEDSNEGYFVFVGE